MQKGRESEREAPAENDERPPVFQQKVILLFTLRFSSKNLLTSLSHPIVLSFFLFPLLCIRVWLLILFSWGPLLDLGHRLKVTFGSRSQIEGHFWF